MPNSAIYSNFEFELLGNAILYWNGAKDPEIGYAHWILLGNFINGLKKKNQNHLFSLSLDYE